MIKIDKRKQKYVLQSHKYNLDIILKNQVKKRGLLHRNTTARNLLGRIAYYNRFCLELNSIGGKKSIKRANFNFSWDNKQINFIKKRDAKLYPIVDDYLAKGIIKIPFGAISKFSLIFNLILDLKS